MNNMECFSEALQKMTVIEPAVSEAAIQVLQFSHTAQVRKEQVKLTESKSMHSYMIFQHRHRWTKIEATIQYNTSVLLFLR